MLSVRFLATELGLGGWSLLVMSLFNVTPCACASGNVTVAWDPNPEENIAGYRVHYGFETRAYPKTIEVGMVTRFTIPDLTLGATYYCAVTAYNSSGLESPFSDEISFTVHPPTDPHMEGEGSWLSRGQAFMPGKALPGLTDQDADGLNDLQEYIMGLDPTVASHRSAPVVEVVEEKGRSYLGIRYQVNAFALSYATVEVERSLAPSDSGSWHRGEMVLLHVTPSPTRSGILEYLERSPTPISAQPQEFLRLRYQVLGSSRPSAEPSKTLLNAQGDP